MDNFGLVLLISIYGGIILLTLLISAYIALRSFKARYAIYKYNRRRRHLKVVK